MTRPTPRRSSLAGASPFLPPGAPPETDPLTAGHRPPAAEAPVAEPSTPQVQEQRRAKVSFYQDPQDTARARGALLHTMAAEGPRTFSALIATALMTEVERLETTYNDGHPFPPLGPRELPQGRPLSGG